MKASGIGKDVGDRRPLVLHVVYRFDTGGLENGIVNLINHMPADAYRHAVLALTDVSPTFSKRIQRQDVKFFSLKKRPGHGVWLYPELFSLFRLLRPAVVHTRNLAALECQVPAWAAGVPARVHGEHGRDIGDLHGLNRRLQWARRIYKPFVHHYFALSRDLDDYLQQRIGVKPGRVTQVYNGVDVERFSPGLSGRAPIPGSPFNDPALWLVGTVGRMQPVKDQVTLAEAFILALKQAPALGARSRLLMVGDGPLRAAAMARLEAAGMAELAWLPGERPDVPDVMRGLDCFVLPSLAEGISNTILEAMASGLPVIATDVGGNADLVVHEATGEIVPAANPQALAVSLVRMASDHERAVSMGAVGRRVVLERFSMASMVGTYQRLYDRLVTA